MANFSNYAEIFTFEKLPVITNDLSEINRHISRLINKQQLNMGLEKMGSEFNSLKRFSEQNILNSILHEINKMNSYYQGAVNEMNNLKRNKGSSIFGGKDNRYESLQNHCRVVENSHNQLESALADKEEIIKMLRQEMGVMKLQLNNAQQNEKYLNSQISRELSSQEYDRTDPHENLNDRSKPSNIVQRSKSLYRDTYTNILSDFDLDKYAEENIQDTLLKLYMASYKETSRQVDEAKNTLISALEEAISKNPLKVGRRSIPKHLEVDVCTLLREEPDDSIKQTIVNGLLSKCGYFRSEVTDTNLKKYIRECVEVTWLMNACMPPMLLSTEGKLFENNKHTRHDGTGPYIEKFVWPCIYFSEDELKKGNVFERGEVVRTKINPENKKRKTATEQPRKQPAGQTKQTETVLKSGPGIAKAVTEERILPSLHDQQSKVEQIAKPQKNPENDNKEVDCLPEDPVADEDVELDIVGTKKEEVVEKDENIEEVNQTYANMSATGSSSSSRENTYDYYY